MVDLFSSEGIPVECAIRIQIHDKKRQTLGLVCISRILREEGKELVKACQYICPDQRCKIPVVAAVPDKIKPGRRKSPRAYFRAASGAHSDDCEAPGITETRLDSVGSAQPVSQEERERQGPYPTKYVEHKSRSGHKGDAAVSTTDEAESKSHAGRSRSSAEHGTGTVSATVISSLVDVFESAPHTLSRMLLCGIPNCPGRTYATVFRKVQSKTVLSANPNSYIYYGQVDSFDEYKSGMFVRFSVPDSDIPFGVWVPGDLQPQKMREDVLAPLKSRVGPLWLYALGAFEPKFHGKKYSIEVVRIGRIWISARR